ncbi:MAG: methyltransferase, partial [Nanoarchaeota archaeon]|nr:methyltransferase [Nanoarchaeota archaeon]
KGNNKKLASLEFKTIWELYKNEKIKLKKIKNTAYVFSSIHNIKSNEIFLNRLTYTNYIGKCLIEEKNIKKLLENIKNLNFNKYENKSFAVRIKNAKKTEKHDKLERELAEPIWENFKNPKVNLKNPDIEFNFFLIDKINYLAIKIFENNKNYLKRMPKLRPIAMPYTLKSDMARACVNLLNLKKGKLIDPFCGIGGILLEAYEMNFEIFGNDISWNDLKYLKINFQHYFPNGKYTLSLADSKTQFLKKNTMDGIVSDIPYGKCSRKLGKDLYENFLISAKQYLKPNKRMILIYANFNEIKTLAQKHFKIIEEVDEYINRSMTRHILILENNK